MISAQQKENPLVQEVYMDMRLSQRFLIELLQLHMSNAQWFNSIRSLEAMIKQS
jgi:hypothetical protein